MTVLLIIAWLLLGLSAAGITLWIIVAVRITIAMRDRSSVREGLDLPAPEGDWPALSIVVPAHNEQRVIDTCASLLRGQDYDNLQIVFVADRCTDDTLERLRRHANEDSRVVVVENTTCPDDWAGKCHAAQRGAQRASGRWILFTDADTRFDPRLARASVALAVAGDLDMLSLLSTLTYDRLFEYAAQPVASGTLLRMYPFSRLSRARAPRPFANGQFMLFRREVYERIGGHEGVKDALLEDLAFAKGIQGEGYRGRVMFDDGMLTCTMYESLHEFEAGWRRIFVEACSRRPARLRKEGLRILVHGTVLPIAQLGTLGLAPVVAASGDVPLGLAMAATALAGWAVQVGTLLRLYATGGVPRRAVLLYPLGCLIVGRIMLTAARDLQRGTPLVWGQRHYVLKPR